MRSGLVLSLIAAGCSTPPVPVENRLALQLDGDDDVVEFGRLGEEHPLQLAGGPFTLSAWFYQEAGGDPYQRILDKSDGVTGRHGWALAANPESGHIHFYIHDGQRGFDFVSSRQLYRPGAWHHVVAVARTDHPEIWMDGSRDAKSWYESGEFTLAKAFPAPLRMGSWNHADGREFQGMLDEIAVWLTDLGGAEIRAIHASRGRADLRQDWGAYSSSGQLAGYWRMENGAVVMQGGQVRDHASTGLHGSPEPGGEAGPAFVSSTLASDTLH